MSAHHYEMAEEFVSALARLEAARAKRCPVLNRQLDEYAEASRPNTQGGHHG